MTSPVTSVSYVRVTWPRTAPTAVRTVSVAVAPSRPPTVCHTTEDVVIIVIMISGVGIGCARRAVHAGSSLWAPDEPCVWKRGHF